MWTGIHWNLLAAGGLESVAGLREPRRAASISRELRAWLSTDGDVGLPRTAGLGNPRDRQTGTKQKTFKNEKTKQVEGTPLTV